MVVVEHVFENIQDPTHLDVYTVDLCRMRQDILISCLVLAYADLSDFTEGHETTFPSPLSWRLWLLIEQESWQTEGTA
jgi:hypothetical protein